MMKSPNVVLSQWKPWHAVVGLPLVFIGFFVLLSGSGVIDSSWAQSCFVKYCKANAPRYPFSWTTLVGVGVSCIAIALPLLLAWVRPLHAILKWCSVLFYGGLLFACIAYFFQPQPVFLKGKFDEMAAMLAVVLSLLLLAFTVSAFKRKNPK